MDLGADQTSELLSAVMTASPGGFVLLDRERRILALNAAARRTLGLAADEGTGRLLSELARAVPSSVDPVAQAYADGTGAVDGLLEVVSERAVTRLAVRAAAFAVGVIVTWNVPDALAPSPRDGERRRWLERAIKELPTAIFMVDFDSGVLIYANDRMVALFGRAMPLGFCPTARARVLEIYDPLTGHALSQDDYPSARARRGEVVRDCPLVWVTALGPRDVSMSAHVIPGQGDGTSAVIMVSVFDLTPLKEIQRRLEESETRLSLALTSADVGTWHVDLATGQVNVSPSTAQIFDYPTSTAGLAEVISARVHPDDVGRVRANWAHSLAACQPYNDEYRVRRTDGSVRWILSRGRVQKDEAGRPTSFSGVLADVTDRAEAREQLERAKVAAETANQAKSAFLANISHEIRTPLGAILGFAELARDDDASPLERQRYLTTILRNGQALTRIIDDLLDLAKVESGQLDVELIEVRLPELLAEVNELFAEPASAKDVRLFTEIGPGVPERVWSDPTRLRQILINVVGNAIKFTARGEVAVLVDARVADEHQVSLEIRVRDTGLGLSDEQRERLFRPFVQADNSTTRRFGGTGLGLALSRRLANALGGDVVVEASAPGRGSVFLITVHVHVRPAGG